MDTENEQAQVDVVEQEEQTSEDVQDTTQETEEDTVTIPKQRFVKMQRKAQAYDATKTDNTAKKPINNSSDAKWRERIELKTDGYNDQEVDFILKNGGKKSLENPLVSKAIEGLREQQKAENATVDVGPKSETERRLSPQEFAKLSATEQAKILSELN